MLPTSAANTSKAAPRARMNGEQRRQHFIDAALHLFSSNGFRGTSTKAIAEAAGASEALLFRHFATKADLYAAILEQKAKASGFSQRLDELRRLARGDDDQALVHALVRSVLDSYEHDTVFERLMLYAALEGHELATASRQLFGQPAFTLLREYVVRRQQAGALRRGDPVVLVFALLALPVYFSMTNRVLGKSIPVVRDRAVVTLFTQLVLDGVRMHTDDVDGRTAKARPPSADGKPAPAARRRRHT